MAIASGLVASMLINNISRLLCDQYDYGVFGVALVLFVIIGWLLEYTAPQNATFREVLDYVKIFYIALAPGVVLDVTLDSYIAQLLSPLDSPHDKGQKKSHQVY